MTLSKLFFLLFFSVSCFSVEYLKPKKLALEYASIKKGSRDPFVPTGFDNKLDLTLDWWVVRPLYWNNMIHSTTDGSQFRTISWEYEFGISLTQWLDLFWYHHSRHLLDLKHPTHAFPVMDAYGFRLNLLR